MTSSLTSGVKCLAAFSTTFGRSGEGAGRAGRPALRRALGWRGGGGRCKSAAVPSKCYSKAEAAKLRPGVFQCDAATTTDAAAAVTAAAADRPQVPHPARHAAPLGPAFPVRAGRRVSEPFRGW